MPCQPGEEAELVPQISVCIVCRNEADRLEDCLASVRWADEILMMDLSSTDGSALLAARLGAKVISHAPHPIVEPLRNELAAAASGEWILALDPDERIAPGLPQELRRLSCLPDIDAVVIPRMNYDLGYPPSNPLHRYEPQLRMYRRAKVIWPVIPNALPAVPEERKYTIPPSDDRVIIHIRNRNIPEILERAIRYAPAQAQSMLDQGQDFSAQEMFSYLFRTVDKQFFVGKAWEDGVPGILRASILVIYKFYVWTSFWQLSGSRRTLEDDRFIRRVGSMAYFGWRVLRFCTRIYQGVLHLINK